MAKLPYTDLVLQMVNERYINVQKHPTEDLYLYNYSKSCQIEHVWNDATCMCRGVVCDKNLNIVARPFVKFFNYEEMTDTSVIPNLPFEAYEKLDGSLGIMYWIGNTPYICTRGSFTSAQALHATEILHKNYQDKFYMLDRSKTYLFEIIWNEDVHCIKYGDTDDIFLLAVIDTDTGAEDDISNWSEVFKCTKKYDGVKDWKTIRDLFSGDNREGFVIKFSNNFRIKLKYEEYFKLHFIKEMITEKRVFNYIVEGKIDEVAELVNKLSEEHVIYFNKLKNKILGKFYEIEKCCIEFYNEHNEFSSDAEAAKCYLGHQYSDVLFKMRKSENDKSKYTDCIWRHVKKEVLN